MVNGPGNHFLAAAAFTRHQHGFASARHAPHQLQQATHRFARKQGLDAQ